MDMTRYGSLWAAIPQTAGKVWWVAPSASYTVAGETFAASDNNRGDAPHNALLTLAQAITNATANAGDVIVLLPGAHSWSASAALSKAGLTVTGLPGGRGNFVRPRTSITTTATDEVINVTAADIEISHLRVIPVSTKAGIDFTSAANRLYIHDCSFDLATPAANTGTQGVAASSAAQAPSHVLVENCYFESDGAQGPAVEMGDGISYVVRNCIFELSVGTWAAAASGAGATNQRGLWQSNVFLPQNGATLTIGIRGTDIGSASSVGVIGNFFGDDTTKGVDDFGSGDAYIAENYQASIGGGSGGAIVTAIT